MITVANLVKEFSSLRRRLRALDGVSFTVGRSEVFGLLGANGAGKTTLVKILTGLTRPTSGNVTVHGKDPRHASARRRVGYLPEGHRFPGYLPADGAMRLFGRLAGVPERSLDTRIPELLALVGLADRSGDRVGRFSKGMTQRLGLACALVDDPDVLFLDEPTDGVDPVGRREIRDVLLATKARGTTIFINSHLLSEVERTCDRVAILDHGRLLREGSIEDLTRPGHAYRIRLGNDTHPSADTLATPGVRVTGLNGAVHVEVDSLEALNGLLDRLRAERLLIAEVTQQRAALEDVFVEVIQEGATKAHNGEQP